MRFTIVAVAVGLVIGLLAGGRPRHMAGRSVRFGGLLFAGLVLQVVSAAVDSTAGLVLLLTSYLLLLAFAVGNVALTGMWLVALGVGLNLVVIGVNGGMPVRPSALVAAGIADPEDVHHFDVGGKRHVERPSDRLTAISDIIPVPPLAEVMSFGDIVMNVGLADVIVHLMRPRRGALATAQ